MKISFQIEPENYVGYDGGIAVIHIKKSELTPKIISYLEEGFGRINIEDINKKNSK